MDNEYKTIKDSWDQKAKEWHIQVGDEGDTNRRFNSDPVLWKFLGNNLNQKTVLDAGCGNGYLSRQLAKKGAIVTGVDISAKMIDIAKELTEKRDINVTYYVNSVHKLQDIKS